MLNISRILFLILSFTFLSACQHKFNKNKEEQSADIAYTKGINALQKNDYKKASHYLTQVFFLDPASPVVEKAQILEIYCNFISKQYDEAIEVAENFLRFYPENLYSDYVSYINALSHYVQITPVYLDQAFTYKTKSLFEDFIKNYPNSVFNKFAKQKLLVVNEHLAGKEMDIGRYYLFLNDPIGGVVRFKTVLSEYSRSNQVPEALYRLSLSFMMLGIEDEAVKYASVLGHNFPDSQWYNYAFNIIRKTKSLQKSTK
jgi:outer membrane protein assembly factor BamD